MTLAGLALELVLGAQPTLPAPAPSSSGTFGELLELAKLLGGGAAGTFALLAWQALRTERQHRRTDDTNRTDRQRDLDARLERLATTLARLDERTQLLVGQLLGPGPESHKARRGGGRAATPAHGVPVARKPDD